MDLTSYPLPGGVFVTAMAVAGDTIVVAAESRLSHASCPCCSQVSHRIHSRYIRAVADQPLVQAAETPGLTGFAQGLRRDEAAVRAALSMPWSNGPVEGAVNRLKFLKRQMFGRAGFGLLKTRVLNAA